MVKNIFLTVAVAKKGPKKDLGTLKARRVYKKSNGGGGDSGGGDDDNNGGGGGGGTDDNNGGGHGSRGNGNGNGSDKNKGGRGGSGSSGGEMKGNRMDFIGQPSFGYKYGYHAGNENGHPVGQLQYAQGVES
ncbi:hypothetical protein ACOSQ4_003897 [Xanthoceras sorbifolium]